MSQPSSGFQQGQGSALFLGSATNGSFIPRSQALRLSLHSHKSVTLLCICEGSISAYTCPSTFSAIGFSCDQKEGVGLRIALSARIFTGLDLYSAFNFICFRERAKQEAVFITMSGH